MAARQANRNKFQKYILTSCWVKMHNRAEHWISLGMIYWICRISERLVRAETENISEVTTMEADQDLVTFIEGSLAPGSSYIRDILKYQVIANNNNEHFSVVENIEILIAICTKDGTRVNFDKMCTL